MFATPNVLAPTQLARCPLAAIEATTTHANETAAKVVLFLLLATVAAIFCAVWLADLLRDMQRGGPTVYQALVGFITNFFDTLGIGSYATTTSLYRPRRTVADEDIPGTLTIGHAIPTFAQAFIYITIVKVEMKTLILMIAASVLGAWLGAGIVTRLERSRIQIGMSVALFAAAAFIVGRLTHLFAEGGETTYLNGTPLVVALAGNFVIGALMTIGIGAYAPIMILVSLLGMSEKTAFPIMMGSCAFLMPVAGLRFIRRKKYNPRAALGLTLGGLPAVFLAAFLVKEMPLEAVRCLVVVIVIYTAATLLRTARRERHDLGERRDSGERPGVSRPGGESTRRSLLDS